MIRESREGRGSWPRRRRVRYKKTVEQIEWDDFPSADRLEDLAEDARQEIGLERDKPTGSKGVHFWTVLALISSLAFVALLVLKGFDLLAVGTSSREGSAAVAASMGQYLDKLLIFIGVVFGTSVVGALVRLFGRRRR